MRVTKRMKQGSLGFYWKVHNASTVSRASLTSDDEMESHLSEGSK